MFKMMRSAGSCLNWEPGMEGGTAVSRRHSDAGRPSYVDGSCQPASDRTLKRLGGVARPRLSRAKPTERSENTAPSNSNVITAQPPVLGDVTNRMQSSGNAVGSKQHVQPVAKVNAEIPVNAKAPKSTNTVVEKVAVAEGPAEMIELDKARAHDAEFAVEYIADIFENLRENEALHLPHPGFLEGQTQVNSKMRAILVDWLVDVHRKYKMLPATLFMGVSLIDRFLEKKNTQRKHLQLVGVTSLFIAAKYEEVYPPKITDFVYVTDKAYSKNEIIDMEIRILSALDFNICRPLSVNFLERYQQVNGCTELHSALSEYLLELTLPDSKMVKYSPSHMAAAAILLSNKLMERRPSWPSSAMKHTKMTESMIKECAKEMCNLLESAEGSQLQAVRKKFSQVKHHSVAKLSFAPSPQSNSAASDSSGRATGREAGQRRLSNVSVHSGCVFED